MTQNAVIYARYSSLEQGKGYSLERQINNGKAYVEKQGWTLDAVLADEGRSAFHGANRSAGSSLHSFEIEARDGLHRGKVLCVENIDRLSRQGAKVASQLVWALNENGVDVSTWHDGMTYRAGNNGNMGELFTLILKASLAHEESEKKSKRTSDSWTKRYREISSGNRSVLVGQTPAWIVEQDGKYALHPARVAVLNEIYDRYIAGTGIYKIVQTLNDRGEPVWTENKRNKGGGWYLAYIHRLLTRRTVLGEYVTLKGETLAHDFWPQAITAEKFNQAQAVRGGKRSTGGGDRVRINNLLGGMVRCAACGGNGGYENKGERGVTRYVGKNGVERQYQRKHYERLRCDKNRRKHGCENGALFDYKVVEGAVLDRLLTFTLDDAQATPKLIALREQIAETERELSVTAGKLSNIVDAIADGGGKALMARLSALEADVEAQEARLTQLRKEAAIEDALPDASDDIAMIESLRGSLSDPDFDVRYYARSQTNMALKRVIDGILLGEDGSFSVLTDFAVWAFDGEGSLIGGQAI